jgi:O-methyltransferase
MLRSLVTAALQPFGYAVRRVRPPAGCANIPDVELYRPLFTPWLAPGPFQAAYAKARPFTVITPDRLHVLYTLAQQASALAGEFWECGVYRGGTAMLLADVLSQAPSASDQPRLRLFDTFEGMPKTDGTRDLHAAGDFADTSAESVLERVGGARHARLHQGFLPASFRGLDGSAIAFAHVDLDIFRSMLDACAFIYPRMVRGGFIVFDDYGMPSCPGARQAVDEFFRDRPERPIILPTGQAVVVSQH